MKKVMLLLLMSLSLVAFAQKGGTNDILFTKSGEIIQGKVVKVTSSTISFSYPGETLVNEIAASNLQKIVFSSGRTQNFGGASSGTAVKTPVSPGAQTAQEPLTTTIPKEEIYLGPEDDTAVVNNNRLAVTPMTFKINGQYSKEISGQATKFATDYLSRKNQSLPIEVQEMGITIRKLVDGGIGFQQLSQTTVQKLQNVLGSEYLVMIEITETNQKAETPKADTGFFDVQKEKASSSDSNQRYDIEVILYGNGGAEKYSAKFSNERSFNSSNGSSSKSDWKMAMQYVLDQILTSGSL